MDALFRRRSIRKYIKDKPIEKEKIEILLKAGFAAPSARNCQPYNFIVIDDRNVLDKIPTIHPYASMSLSAPLAILVMGDNTLQENVDYLLQDCSAATENILIEATQLSLGSVWLGVYPRKERIKGIIELLNIPKKFIPISLIVIGYPAEKKEPSDRFDSRKVFYNILDKE